MGTIGIEATLGFRDRLAAVRPGVTFVDAPVSGSKGPAEQGQLLILASGPETAASPLRPVFDAIGRKTVWLGQVGQGSIVSLSTWEVHYVQRCYSVRDFGWSIFCPQHRRATQVAR